MASWLRTTVDWLSDNVFGAKRKLDVGDDDGSEKEEPKAKRVKREAPAHEHKAKQIVKEEGSEEKKAETLKRRDRGSQAKSSAKNSSSETTSSKSSTRNSSSETTSSNDPPTVLTSHPYDEFTQENFMKHGVFIFAGDCPWDFVPDVIEPSPFGNGKGSMATRGCTYATRGQLPESTRFVVIQGIHPMFPQMTSFYSIGVVLSNENGRSIVDFLKIGNLGDLQEETRNALVRSLPGLISTTRLAELWHVAWGSLELQTAPDANKLNENEFVSEGPMVYHGNFGWSYSKGTCCWVVTSSMPPMRRRHVVVVGHPFSQSPEEYAIGVVVKLGAHMSLVDFRMKGVVTALSPPTVSALVGRLQPFADLQLSRQDIWRQATLPMK